MRRQVITLNRRLVGSNADRHQSNPSPRVPASRGRYATKVATRRVGERSASWVESGTKCGRRVFTRENVFPVRCDRLPLSVLDFAVDGPVRPTVTPSSALSAVCLPHFVPLSLVGDKTGATRLGGR